MPNGYDVQPGELDLHARHVDAVTDALRTALDAARSVSLPTNAYGIICQIFPPLLRPVQQVGLNAITEAINALADNASGLRGNARTYRDTDSHAAGTFIRRSR